MRFDQLIDAALALPLNARHGRDLDEATHFSACASSMFGRVRAHLEAKGKPIGALDTLVAAHALALGLTLVTGDTKHFSRVGALRTESWSARGR